MKSKFFPPHLEENIPGFLFKAVIQSPESSEITGIFVNVEKYFALSLALPVKVLAVSFGLFIFNLIGETFLIFLDKNLKYFIEKGHVGIIYDFCEKCLQEYELIKSDNTKKAIKIKQKQLV